MIGAEVLGDGNAIEVLAYLTVVDWCDVEEEEKPSEEQRHGGQTDPDERRFAPALVHAAAECDKRQQRVRQQEAEDEAEEVGVVVDPRQQPGQEQHGRHSHQLEDRHLGISKHRPLVNHLHHAAGQQTEVCTGWANLKEIEKKGLFLEFVGPTPTAS